MCDIQNNGKIQREFETRSTDDQPTIQWLPVVGSWTFLGVNMHFNEKLFMCDSCNFLVRAYQSAAFDLAIDSHLHYSHKGSFSGGFHNSIMCEKLHILVNYRGVFP